MTTNTFALDLYKANIQLQLHITRMLQQSSGAWLDAAQYLNTQDLDKTADQIKDLINSASWQAMVTLTPDSFSRMMEHQLQHVQTINEVAARNQLEFMSGLQEALQAWQIAVSQAFKTD